jgi:AcrR family transcriptional regulator
MMRYRWNMLDIRAGVSRRETRANLVKVAAQLLHDQGATAVTTRAVAQAAGVQAPTIYRLFGDKDGLLDAVAEHVFAAYVADKALVGDSGDPVADLRAGWDMHVGFGLANAALFGLLIDPSRGTRSPAAAGGLEVLRARVHRVAADSGSRSAAPLSSFTPPAPVPCSPCSPCRRRTGTPASRTRCTTR